LAVLVVLLLLPPSVREPQPGSSRQAAAMFAPKIIDVRAGRGVHFDARDNVGVPLATLKVVQAGPPRSYVGVYHAVSKGRYSVRLSTSSDLQHFRYAATLASGASQPTIAPNSQGGFLAAWEKQDPGGRSHLEFASYASLADLLAGRAKRILDVPRTLSTRNEGTPSIYPQPRATGDAVLATAAPTPVGFHYYDQTARADRNARGQLLVDGSFTSTPATDLNAALRPQVRGNIGDRDTVDFEGYQFTVVEGQTSPNDFGSFRLFLFDQTTRRLRRLDVRTPAGSGAFGNPELTVLVDPAGHRALFVSIFVFAQAARGGEAGPLTFYREF
jgi:hypothetical protein